MTRYLDFVLASGALVVLSPLLLVTAVAIRLDSPGPATFRQVRIGEGGQPFIILKFRTMNHAASGHGTQVTSATDPRVTRLGRLLRSTKVDELPQLVNVLRGEMSLVGPRPEVPQYVAMWSEADRGIILSVRPGITDPASLQFRRESETLATKDDPEQFYREVLLPAKARTYVSYVQTRSIAGDLRIILATLREVLLR